MAAFVGSAIPSASTIEAIVEAVPMVMQWPEERDIAASAWARSSMVISPVFSRSVKIQVCVPDPTSSPRNRPLSMGPPETTRVGRSQLAAPMTSAGVVLSQPVRRITPSIG